MFTRSFTGFKPPRRFDGEPFTEVTVGEAEDKAGPFTTLETITLDPVDADPSKPQARDFTTDLATLVEGWYLVTWADADGVTFDADPISFPTDLELPDWAPGPSNVAALIRARTVDDVGHEIGSFTDETRPTGDEVERLISRAVDAVEARVGPIPDTAEAQAGDAVALYAAMLIELSYWPEQIREDRSPYTELKALYEEAISALLVAAAGGSPTKGVYSVPMHPDVPSYLIPALPDS